MANRRDKNDSTMDISASQLVPEKRPPAPQTPAVNKNDVSMWIGGVVGADEFSGSKKRVTKSRAPLAIGVVALLAAAGGGAYYMFRRPSSSTPVAAPATPGSAALGSAIDVGSAPVAAPADAADTPPAITTLPIDAGAEIAPGDAGVALAADAISGADPKHKPATTTKKKSTKKTVKKPAKKPTTTKRR